MIRQKCPKCGERWLFTRQFDGFEQSHMGHPCQAMEAWVFWQGVDVRIEPFDSDHIRPPRHGR